MSADACEPGWHLHMGVCQRAGYANGRANALAEVEARLAAVRALADEWDDISVDDEWDAADRWSDAPYQLRAALGADS